MKCWCNCKKEAHFLFLHMRVTLASAQTGSMESHKLIVLLLLFPSNTLNVFLFGALHITLYHSVRAHTFISMQASFNILWLFVYSSDGGAAVELRRLFIIPLTSWIRAAIITWAWIFMRWGSMRVWERLTSKNRQKGRATNSSLQTHSQKANTMQTFGGKRAKYRNTFLTCCYCFGEIWRVKFGYFSILKYHLLQSPRKLNRSSVKSGTHKHLE